MAHTVAEEMPSKFNERNKLFLDFLKNRGKFLLHPAGRHHLLTGGMAGYAIGNLRGHNKATKLMKKKYEADVGKNFSTLNKPIELQSAAWTRKEGKRESGGLNRKGVASYRAANPGSKLKTAVTKDPKKLKKGGKAAKRRASFCRRMRGMKAKRTSAKTANDPNSRINKSLRAWNCEAIAELFEFATIQAKLPNYRAFRSKKLARKLLGQESRGMDTDPTHARITVNRMRQEKRIFKKANDHTLPPQDRARYKRLKETITRDSFGGAGSL